MVKSIYMRFTGHMIALSPCMYSDPNPMRMYLTPSFALKLETSQSLVYTVQFTILMVWVLKWKNVNNISSYCLKSFVVVLELQWEFSKLASRNCFYWYLSFCLFY